MTANKDELVFGRSDLEAAVAKGVLERSAADGLAEFLIESRKETSGDPDEERLRLITGFNDIFVTIGIALFLGALGYSILGPYGGPEGGLGVAVASWGLAETGATGPAGNRYGDAAGHACLAVSGARSAAATLETGSSDREANMRRFASAALAQLINALE
jgi:hypothetical protein